MINRRSMMMAGLAMAGAASSTGIAQAQAGTQSGRPMLVFVGHEL
jgi:F0F1-type ATP synthase membrane subunit c/vacuolar-type H+-ATPase subunit K